MAQGVFKLVGADESGDYLPYKSMKPRARFPLDIAGVLQRQSG